ncbi:MAG: DNA-processing protein DprA [Acidimicrobiales bacterium]
MFDDGLLPAEAWVAALLQLDSMGPAKMRVVLAGRTPAEAWAAIVSDEPLKTSATLRQRWRVKGRSTDVKALWQQHTSHGISVLLTESVGFPARLIGDPEPPDVLFVRGDLGALRLPTVAIIGTRNCTQYGADVAYEFGRDLAATGICVLSGLALGIDAAAHAGALAANLAPPVAVVGSGLNRIYPSRNRALWTSVAQAGAVVSEYPLGSAPLRWHFPARNRILAGLADVVVVVESGEEGGSMHTVAEAAARDRTVMAVPGPIRSPASVGTNQLLADGCAPAASAGDIVAMLGLCPISEATRPTPITVADKSHQRILDSFCWQSVDLNTLVKRTGMDFSALSIGLERLRQTRQIVQRGQWFERTTGHL